MKCISYFELLLIFGCNYKNVNQRMRFLYEYCIYFQCIIGEDRMIRLSGVPLGEACTVVLRGATNQILEEAERSLHDALCVLTQTVKETRTVFGGGEKVFTLKVVI